MDEDYIIINYPYISDDLINALVKTFPNKLPKKEITMYDLGRLIGQQDIIDRLIVEKKLQEEKDL